MPFDKAQLAQRTVDAALRTARAHGGKVHKGAIHSSVAGRTDHLPMHVASGSYVIPADIISAMGEGNSMAGFKVAKSIFGRHHTRDITKGTPYGESGMPYSKAEGGRAGYLGGGGADSGQAANPQARNTDGNNGMAASGGNGKSASYNANQAASARYAQQANQRYGDAIPANLQSYLPGGSNAAYGSAPASGRAMENGAGAPRSGLFSGLFGGGGGGLFGGNQSSGVSPAPAAGQSAGKKPSWFNQAAPQIGTVIGGPLLGLIGAGIKKDDQGRSGFSRLGDKLGMADGGATEGVPIVAAGGEYVIPPEDVVHIGGGDLDHGHKILDSFVKKMRQKTIKTLQNLPNPKKD